MLVEVKNYTKPNILLLGPTGSGKTYLLRNLAATWNKEVADECGKVLGCLVGVGPFSGVGNCPILGILDITL